MPYPASSSDSQQLQLKEYPSDYLTSEQRLDAIVEILAAVTARIIKKRHDQNISSQI